MRKALQAEQGKSDMEKKVRLVTLIANKLTNQLYDDNVILVQVVLYLLGYSVHIYI